MDAAQPAVGIVVEPAPPLRPREELFCRTAARLLTFRYRLEKKTHASRTPVRTELRRELRTEIAAGVTAGGGPERSVTYQDAGRDFSRPAADTAPTTQPQPAEPSVTNRDVGGNSSRPAAASLPLRSRGRWNIP